MGELGSCIERSEIRTDLRHLVCMKFSYWIGSSEAAGLECMKSLWKHILEVVEGMPVLSWLLGR